MRRRSWVYVFVTCLLLFLPSEAMTPDPCCSGDNVLTTDGCPEYKTNDVNTTAKRRHTLLQCEEGSYVMNPKLSDDDNFTLNEDGELILISGDDYAIIEKGRFCISNMRSEGGLSPVAQICFAPQTRDFKYTLTAGLTVLSIGFLILTVAVYGIVSELRDIQGKCIICTCCSLALGFFFLAIANLSRINVYELCAANGYLMYYWVLSSFFWMNVLSINVWKAVAFGNIRIPERRQLIAFVLYGWGMPLVLLIISVITNHVEGSHVKPGIGINSCWFRGKLATWVYFYGPIAVLLSINTILFIWTSRTLWQETSYCNMTKVKALKFKFFLYLKVFFVMGIGWIFELISFANDNESFFLWVVMDIFNCLQGVFLFIVLVLFRKKAMKGLHDRGIVCGCLPASWTSGPDDECEEIIEAMVESDPAATPLNL